MMDIFDIYIAYISWNGDGKMRPVLVVGQQGSIVFVFNITTRYAAKSAAIRAKYFKIRDWAQAGLMTQSYVDTNTVRDLPLRALTGKTPIGKLTKADEYRLIQFLNQSI